jgi:hypothetical protein
MIGIQMRKMIILFTLLMLFHFSLFSQEIIQNPGKPLRSDAGRILKVEELFRITDESGKFFFTRPSGLQVAEDDSIFLTDENQFLKFSSDGEYLINIFKKGQGPGEIAGAFFYYYLQGEKIFIYDPMNSKIIIADQEGNLIEEFRFTARYPQFIGLWEDKLIFTKYFWPAMEDQTGKLFDIPGKILYISREGSIVDECPGIPISRYLHPNLAVRMPVLATQISEDGKFCFIGDPDEYVVSVLDLEKLEFIRKFKREYPRVKRQKRETPPKSSIKIPEIKYENDIVDLYNFKGNLWIETSTDDDKKGTLYDVFNKEGRYIDCFWLNVGGSLMTTHGDFLFVREQDEDGSMSIVKYRVLETKSDSNKISDVMNTL